MIPDYTLVCGVDRRHLDQLSYTWPTWRRHKPSLLKQPMLVFFDRAELTSDEVAAVVDHPHLSVVGWPPTTNGPVTYEGTRGDKWTDPQRYKMLAGFVHIALLVRTQYWLKLDTDVVATSNDEWIDPQWFASNPAIVSHRWSFTRPPDQMTKLDQWVAELEDLSIQLSIDLRAKSPLRLIAQPGADRVGHKRIISWCAFFRTDFCRRVSLLCSATRGDWKLPVPSQDGVLWYIAKRLGEGIIRTNMKGLGWQQWLGMNNIRSHAAEAMQ